jgi:hypothetical protein
MIFNWEYYKNIHYDLSDSDSDIYNYETALKHFEKFGKKEKRIYIDICILFNWKEYIEQNKDLKNIMTEEDAWKHFLYHGKKENRKIRHWNILKKYCI